MDARSYLGKLKERYLEEKRRHFESELHAARMAHLAELLKKDAPWAILESKPPVPRPTDSWLSLYEQERAIALQAREWVVGL